MSRHDYHGPFRCAPDPGQPRRLDDHPVWTALCVLIAVPLVLFSFLETVRFLALLIRELL